MNFLAHSVLAGDDTQVVLGSLIGDFVKGVLRADQLPKQVLLGVRLHRRVDAFSNQLPQLTQSVARLPDSLRRYAPPCIDVLADHFLAQQLNDEQAEFSNYREWLYELALGEGVQHAPGCRAFFARAQDTDLFGQYAQWSVCARTIEHVCSRMPPTALGVELGPTMSHEIQTHLTPLAADFERYWPLLREHALVFLSQQID